MEQRNQRGPSFAGLIANIIQRNGRVENAQLHSPAETRFCGQQASIKAMATAGQADSYSPVEDGRITSWRMRY